MILSGNQGLRSRLKVKPKGAEFSKIINGVRFYYRKCSVFPWLNEYWSYIHNRWILIS